MKINQILTKQRTLCNAPSKSKKRVLEYTADFISKDITEIDSEELFEQLTARERLGSTGLGKGVAIPHCRCNKVSSTVGTLIKLKEAIDFDAADGHPVDILFVLIVPEDANDEHLKILAELAQLMDQSEFRNCLRKASSSDELYLAATEYTDTI